MLSILPFCPAKQLFHQSFLCLEVQRYRNSTQMLSTVESYPLMNFLFDGKLISIEYNFHYFKELVKKKLV